MTVGDATIRDIDVKRCLECGARFGVDAAFCPFDGNALSASTWDPTGDPLVGSIVDQRYEVHEPLGEGGMGSVYRVRHLTLDRMFAIKILRRDLASDQALAARFEQEARATAAIKHPGVVAITDFGKLDDGTPYFVMELLEGETLATHIRARGPMQPRSVIAIARRICDALQASHDAGVVHRDLKPENVFLVGRMAGKAIEEEVRVVDFGAAKVVGGSKLTRPGIVFGTPYYMSPEQAGGQAVDGRADVYSLGVLMYEMLTGAVPFEADTYMGVLTKHMFAAPARPSERVAPGVQLGELEGVIMRALEKDPAMRFRSMRELSDALDAARKGTSTSAPPPAMGGKGRSVAPLGPSTADRIELSVAQRVLAEERARRNRVVVVAALTASITVLVGLVGLKLLGRDDAPAPAVSASVASAPTTPASSAGAAPSGASGTSTSAAVASAPPSASAETTAATASGAASGSTDGAGATPPSTVAGVNQAVQSTSKLAVARPKPTPTPVPPPVASTAPPPTPRPSATTAPPPRPKSPDDLPDPWGR